MKREVRPAWHGAALLCLLAVGTVWIADDGRHYWHDVRFLYVASQFSFGEALSGAFNPHQAWQSVDEFSSSGFYAAKMLHIGLLHLLYRAVPLAEGGLELSVWLSIGLVAAACLAAYPLFHRILGGRRLAWLAVAAMLAAPVTPYLAGKLIAEVPSLFLSVAGLVFLARAFDTPQRSGLAWALAAGFMAALASTARIDSVVGPIGFALASILTAGSPGARAAILRRAGAAFAIYALAYLGALAALGIDPQSLAAYFTGFVTAGSRSILMSVLGVATFGGGIYVLALLAGVTADRETRRRAVFLAVWLGLACLPMIAIASRYWIEPRYLVQGLVPLSALAALGLDRLWSGLRGSRLRFAILGAGVGTILGVNYAAVGLMPYELDRRAILAAVDEIVRDDPDAAILVPWAYTDFHFLTAVAPQANIYNVNGTRRDGADPALTRVWHSRYRRWYGDRYLSDPDRLRVLAGQRPVYYLGWTFYPPLQNALRWAARAGLPPPPSVLRDLGLVNHLEQSWLWMEPGFQFDSAGQVGQYRYWRVSAAPP